MKKLKLKQRRNKFNATRTIVDSIVFHSAAEANRYKILKILEKSGHIQGLRLQVPCKFYMNAKQIFVYYADFVYLKDNKEVYEDVKGMRTPLYRLKKKLIEAQWGIIITEI